MIQSKRGTLTDLKRNPAGQSKYDSLLERDYMNELEREGGVVRWTKEHSIKIPYRIFGIIPRNYLPDFLVTYEDGSQELHETKGAGFLFWLETHAKRAAADVWCKSRGMKYKFIENSRGAMFANNNALFNANPEITPHQRKTSKVTTLDDLLK